MPRRRPSENFEAQLPVDTERDWLALAVSGLSHLLLIMAALLFAKRAAEKAAETPQAEAPKDTREVAMVYLPPPPRPVALPNPQPTPPAPTPPVVAPPAPSAQNKVPEPEPNAPPDAKRTEGVADPKPQGDPTPTGDPDAPRDASPDVAETPKGVALEVTMEQEAKRIFGRKRGSPADNAGPVATKPLESAKVPENPCGEVPLDSTGAPIQGMVQGVVRDVDGGGPLAGAHLQMVGQPYATFANNRGEFKLLFDITLMADCRTQYVRIEAPGFRSQMLPIVIGGGVSTVGLRRR